MRLFTFGILIISIISCKEQKLPVLNLPNKGVLKIKDSFQLKLDSLTIPNSEYVYLYDSNIYICNTEASLITKINLYTNYSTTIYLNFLQAGRRRKFSSIWVSKSNIYTTSNKSKKGFIFNMSGLITDSFQLTKSEFTNLDNVVTDNPLVSTIQPMKIKDSIIYTLGFALLEGNHFNNDRRFVVNAGTRFTQKSFINYPKSNNEKNWGGSYFRMVYSTSVNDSLFVVSFPATSEIARFNVENNNTQYIKCFPSIDSVVSPVGSMKELNKKQVDIAKHFFKQYTFQAILFDKYRNIFYRILLKPKPIEAADKNSICNFDKLILVYDKDFNYFGFIKLNGKSYSNTTFLVHPDGLLLQKIKNLRDEENMYFDLFVLDSTLTK